MNKGIFGKILGVLTLLCLSLICIFLCSEYVGQRTEVEGMSMYPTLSDNENLILDKITYLFREPKRYDIVVFLPPYKENTYYIKRIIGMPGEKVQIIDGEVYINGKLIEDGYGYEKMKSSGLASEAFVLAEDEYFVLGDNRNNSLDSREPEVGNVKRDMIIGRAVFRIWPLNRLGLIE